MTLGAVARLFRRAPRSLPPTVGYALWAENYPPTPHNALMRAEQAAMVPYITAARACRALDVGTGTGRYVPIIANAGVRSIIGADLSMPMLIAGRSRHARVCADACRVPFRDGSFDLIVSSLMVGDIVDVGAWVAEAARLLVPGGHAVYSDFHPSWTVEGWRRTFRSVDGTTFQLPFHPHDVTTHVSAIEACGLELREVREPCLRDEDAVGIARRRARRPVVIVFHAVKPPRYVLHRRQSPA